MSYILDPKYNGHENMSALGIPWGTDGEPMGLGFPISKWRMIPHDAMLDT